MSVTTRTCEEISCNRKHLARGMCGKHYDAARRMANPGATATQQAAWYAAHREQERARSAAWRAANPERVATTQAAWRAANRARRVEQDAQRRATYPERVAAVGRASRLRTKYGLSLADYDALLAAQGGGCAICGATVAIGIRHLAVDHDHTCCPGKTTCGKCVRGILCTRCNHTLGNVADDPAILIRMIDYLNGDPS